MKSSIVFFIAIAGVSLAAPPAAACPSGIVPASDCTDFQCFYNHHKEECVYRCSQPMKVGPCRALIPSYWYNSTSGMCEFFYYGGCDTNGNLFDTLSECEAVCADPDPPAPSGSSPPPRSPCEPNPCGTGRCRVVSETAHVCGCTDDYDCGDKSFCARPCLACAGVCVSSGMTPCGIKGTCGNAKCIEGDKFLTGFNYTCECKDTSDCPWNTTCTTTSSGRRECLQSCDYSCPKCLHFVCGSDGNTYGNRCQLDIAQCQYGGISYVKDGSCKKDPKFETTQGHGC